MKSIFAYEVKVEATIGAVLNQCIKDCIILAMSERRIITLTHNDNKYKIDPDNLINSIKAVKETTK